MNIYDHLDLFCCPDCNAELVKYNDDLQCKGCQRVFKIFENICVDFLPKRKFTWGTDSQIVRKADEVYNKLFNEDFSWKENPAPWGLNAPESFITKLQKHKHVVYNAIPTGLNGKCIDISTGSGRFSWDLVDRFQLCVFCDISVDSVVFLSKKALKENRNNILIIRSDYTSPPFNEGIFDLCLCQDTLVYSYDHEMKLLSTMNKIMAKNGFTILDFANKYHRGFWHKPYTTAYSLSEMTGMLKANNFKIDEIVKLYYELSSDLEEDQLKSKLLKLFLPSTRYVFRTSK